MNTENSNRNQPHKSFLNLSRRLHLRSLNNHVALHDLSIKYSWKSIRKQYKNNRLKTIAPTWNDEFELPSGTYFVSDIQNYIKYIIKKHETLPAVPPIYFYINRIDNTLVFKVKDGYEVELQTPETMILFLAQ